MVRMVRLGAGLINARIIGPGEKKGPTASRPGRSRISCLGWAVLDSNQ
jgi:hypothetical protein